MFYVLISPLLTEELNRFASSAWGTFTTRFAPYLPHIPTVTTATIPRSWLDEHATIYLCYPLDQLAAASGLVAAIMGGLLKGQVRHPQAQTHAKRHALYAIDEAATVSIYNLDTHLSTVGGYGATLVLYLQALSQLDGCYGVHRARTILANCHHQIYYPPRDPQTERHIADLFGSELYWTEGESRSRGGGAAAQQRSVTSSERERPALARAGQLPPAVVALVSNQYRVVAERLNPIPLFVTLPPPPPERQPFPQGRTSMPRIPAESGGPILSAAGAVELLPAVAAPAAPAITPTTAPAPHADTHYF